ncbi:ankyrin repeat domain-containing protein [Candidatus Chromulinivorax destructor]|uniref:Uncharacterized protein n=1 Tax=Candidatus Chromulinivorax destructor TaxID=2066483 RepID=A0A345ZA78_9BACT|nr:ankyrin repeat domain-containing protein [Candidatus Chromulinivorax destructor]AXK60195.1 hypothetical protein C0J27_00320 [Candidatus Chromulinivorax destructor]
MMKRVRVSVFLMLSLHVISVYAAQDLPQDVALERQVMIDNAVKNFSYLTQGFDFLQTQGIIDTTFHDFLEQNVSHDEHEDEEMNFDHVIIHAEDVLTKNMKDRFLQTLDTTLKEYKKLDDFNDPVFLYVMQHKDYDMRDMVHLWLYEWCNTQNKYKDFKLHTAIYHKEILNILIDAGVDLNAKDRLGKTPLHLLIYNGNTKLVSVLIAAGVDLNIKDRLGQTPLYDAIWSDRIEKFCILLDAGVDLNIQDNVGYTPLHYAALKNKVEKVKILIAAGVDVNLQDKRGKTAEQSSNDKKIKAIFKKAHASQARSHCVIS